MKRDRMLEILRDMIAVGKGGLPLGVAVPKPEQEHAYYGITKIHIGSGHYVKGGAWKQEHNNTVLSIRENAPFTTVSALVRYFDQYVEDPDSDLVVSLDHWADSEEPPVIGVGEGGKPERGGLAFFDENGQAKPQSVYDRELFVTLEVKA